MGFLSVMALPLLACLLLVLILPSLGQHVLARGVIFVDLALAQIAALGQSVAFLLGADPTVKMFGVGLTTSVIVDVTVVRMFLLPALMKLLGRANWWTPYHRPS